MDDEYIRKDVAVDALKSANGSLYWNTTLEESLVQLIQELPPADVIPVVHAHWIRHDDADVVEGYYVPEYECSKCRAWKKDDSDYCPDCGARMDGEGMRECGLNI